MSKNNKEAMSQTYRRPRSIERILHSRGAMEPEQAPSAVEDEPPRQRATFTESGGKPQASFSIVCANGEMHGFHYFNIDNLKFKPGKKGRDYLSFDHRGKVVVMMGRNLNVIFQAVIKQTLCEVREYPEVEAISSETLVSRVDISPV